MKLSIQNRLRQLQSEYQKGQARSSQLEQELHTVQQSMLRISGAIQVLQELLELADDSETLIAEHTIEESQAQSQNGTAKST